MKIVIAPDSFKGSLTAIEAARAVQEGFSTIFESASFSLFPMSDGGEGTLSSFKYVLDRPLTTIRVKNAYGYQKEAALLINGEDAFIESASAVGITDFTADQLNPLYSTSYGVGELIKAALDAGCSRITIGLGGSAVNDGGAGMLEALGATFKVDGQFHGPVRLKDLPLLQAVDLATLDHRIASTEIVIASDVNNPLTGSQGATAVFGPQKGVPSEDIHVIDTWMHHFASLVSESYIHISGSGAAGGLGFALLSIGAKFEQGAKVIGRALNLPEAIRHADLVITGEGKSDNQTLYGKVPHYVAELAAAEKKPVILISGGIDPDAEKLTECFTASFSITHSPCTLDYAIEHAHDLTVKRSREIAKLINMRL
ncbi:glycerate kinase [Jeotgalibacillus sp. R-1-5s-1]|uniref:glycerate kinase n=1 Tax=Jeotgalibacillus sp. R-1-5s-1 TaxID=2555897 RepID=UPI00141A9E4D|nr:glycerate kinase [Jeotgalibacillus sp. R-1-5s-1]